MFLYVTVRFRFGEILYSGGALERYSRICVYRDIKNCATFTFYNPLIRKINNLFYCIYHRLTEDKPSCS